MLCEGNNSIVTRLTYRLALLLGVTALLTSCSPPPQAWVEGGRLEFSLPDLEGRNVSLRDERFKGKVVLVDLFGSWCEPCRRETPFLIRMQEKYGERGLSIVGISFERGRDAEARRKAIRRYAAAKEIDYPVLDGGGTGDVEAKLPSLRGFSGFPTGIFIGREGTVRHVEVGFYGPSQKNIESTIIELLDEGTIPANRIAR